MTAGVTVEAPAKINLYLHVTGRRADGYHLLDSLVAFAGVGDTLVCSPADALELVVEGPMAGALAGLAEENIVLRAARLLAACHGVAPRARITLVKRLPVAAGIGGGSADAAAALRGLCRLWGLAPSADDLAALGLELGADVPVCLAGRPALMAGIGEALAPAPALPPTWLVLANPGVAVSTPAVFAALAGRFSAARPLNEAAPDAAALAEMSAARDNDLTAPAVALAPEIGKALRDLGAVPDCLLARMSGSGATCFGLFADAAAAHAAAAALSARRPGWWIAAAPLLAG
ncbi:MAG: 4-(cytidine 5'-diphospho)-2-C-methyl-D-erythritol kinase [Rhodospirillales bacterium]|nr:4-(cytidine 5'-diphospho)-2-C-methyl-D-erythritol kinase [Rhodospirillales bacterium]